MTGNKLYYGDNLQVLREHIKDESVDLIYLDPPFNSAANYNVLFRAKSGEQSQADTREYQHTMNRIRSPAGYGGEGATRERGEDEPDDKRSLLDHLFVPLERIGKAQPILDRFQNADSRSRVRFGKDVATHLDSILDAHRKFTTAARVRYIMERSAYGKQFTQQEMEQKHQREKLVWTVGEPDELDTQIKAAIDGVEKALGEYMGKEKR